MALILSKNSATLEALLFVLSMLQMYKVFINDNPLFFAQKRAQLSLFQDIKFYNFESSSEFYNKIISLQKANQICILSNQPKEALKNFKSRTLSPVELIDAIITRAEKVQQTINPFADRYF